MANNPRLGIILMIATMILFAVQDAISRYLAEQYNVVTVVVIRYIFFIFFVIVYSHRQPDGFKKVFKSNRFFLQISRGVLLSLQICVAIYGFSTIGLVGFHVVFASYPLIIMALSVPILGEMVGWRRWLAVMIGFCGVLLILRPGTTLFVIENLIPVFGALMFALYGIMTRYVARYDSTDTSFFWTAISGGFVVLLMAPFFWTPPVGFDWGWMAILCLTGTAGHYLLIRALNETTASTIQPFAYLQLVFSSALGIKIFGDQLDPMLIAGALVIVASGLFALEREKKQKANPRESVRFN